jgi:hypothetical protein
MLLDVYGVDPGARELDDEERNSIAAVCDPPDDIVTAFLATPDSGQDLPNVAVGQRAEV